MTIDADQLRKFLKRELSIDIKVEGDDYYSNRSKRVTVRLMMGDTVISSDSFSMVDGEPDREPY